MQFVHDGVLYAELNEMLQKELAEDGYAGVEIRRTPMRTEIIIRATRTREVLGEKGQRIRELTSAVQKRFGFAEGTVEMFAERVMNRGLSAMAQAESLKFKLLGGLQVRRACYGVIRTVMESGALGIEVIVSGKARVQRAKSMKFKSGFLITTGNPAKMFIDKATRHCMMKQGELVAATACSRARRRSIPARVPCLPVHSFQTLARQSACPALAKTPRSLLPGALQTQGKRRLS